MQPPDLHRSRIEQFFDPLPIWYAPLSEAAIDGQEFPLVPTPAAQQADSAPEVLPAVRDLRTSRHG